MKIFSNIILKVSILILTLCTLFGTASDFNAVSLEYEAAYGNPMKGFMPYYSEDGADDSVAYSLEWFYVPLCELVGEDGSFTIKEGLEPYLKNIAARGHQAVFRVYLDYPEKESGVPEYVWNMGVKKYTYSENGGGVSPDYSNQNLIDFLTDFVKALAMEYDGDGRIAYITTGLIGHWGEWHVCDEISQAMPTEAQQEQIINAFTGSFKETKILTRYPGTAGTTKTNIGFHDDSFTYSTLGTKSHYFYNRLLKAGQTNVWKAQAIGGEFRPENQKPFLAGESMERYQSYDLCVKATHCSFLLMHGAFYDLNEAEIAKANEASAQLGYDFYIEKVNVKKSDGTVSIKVTIKNKGVAPIYASPDVFIGTDSDEIKCEQQISQLMPGKSMTFTAELAAETGDSIHIRFGSLYDGCVSIRFSNKGATDSEDGAFILGTVK